MDKNANPISIDRFCTQNPSFLNVGFILGHKVGTSPHIFRKWFQKYRGSHIPNKKVTLFVYFIAQDKHNNTTYMSRLPLPCRSTRLI